MRSPIITGLATAFHEPLATCTEITWRLIYGASAILFLFAGVKTFLQSLPVRDRDALLGLEGMVAQIMRGSGRELAQEVLILYVGAAILWLLCASVGRAATLQCIARNPFHASPTLVLLRMVPLNFVRMALKTAALLAMFGALVKIAALAGGGFPGAAITAGVMVSCAIVSIQAILDCFLAIAMLFGASEEGDFSDSILGAFIFVQKHCFDVTITQISFSALKVIAVAGTLLAALWLTALSQASPLHLGYYPLLMGIVFYVAAGNFLKVANLGALQAIMARDGTNT